MDLSARLRIDLDTALARVGAGESPNQIRDHEGQLPLVTALIVGDIPALKTLLAAGADPYQDFRSLGLYMSAIETAIGGVPETHPEALEILLKHPGVLDEGAPFAHALMETAAKIGNPRTITALVEAGVSLDGPKIAGLLPLEHAVSSAKGYMIRVSTMRALGAKPIEIHQSMMEFRPSHMVRQLVEAMSNGRLYNAARTLDTQLVMHVMSKIGPKADPEDERAARLWARRSKAKGAKEIADLFDGFLQAIKAKEAIRNVVKAAAEKGAPGAAL